MKLKTIDNKEYLEAYGEDHQEYLFMCPGCKYDHRYIVKWGSKSERTEPVWHFNGDVDKPSFTPSLLMRTSHHGEADRICHLYVTNGKIQFLADCSHSLKGQSVEMEEVK